MTAPTPTAPECASSPSWPDGVPDPNPGWHRAFMAALAEQARDPGPKLPPISDADRAALEQTRASDWHTP